MTSNSNPDILAPFGKDSRMIVHTPAPPNLETPLALLEDAITPQALFFMRNNHAIPQIAPHEWRLTIDGLVERPLTIGYTELQRLPVVRSIAVMECSGNSRSRFADPSVSAGQEAEGIPWGNGAIGNAEWTGVPIRLLLEQAGVRAEALQAECWSSADSNFARGIEVTKLMDEAMLAYAMNGELLPPIHGGPARLVVPGWGGINWVKWISRMTLLDRESDSEYNQESYVLYDQDGRAQGKVRQIAVKSVISNITPGSLLATGMHEVRGFAWSPQGVAKVEVSADGGATWHDATLIDDMGPFAWRPFVWRWNAPSGDHVLASRATDVAGNVQPATVPFNLKGYLMNAIQRVPVQVENC